MTEDEMTSKDIAPAGDRVEQFVKAVRKFEGGIVGSAPSAAGFVMTGVGSLTLLLGLLPPVAPIAAIVGVTLLAGGGTSLGIGARIQRKAKEKTEKANIAAVESAIHGVTVRPSVPKATEKQGPRPV